MQHSFDYNLGKYRLSINYWFLIIFLLVQTGLNELGFWQLSRAQEKQDRLDLLANDHNPPITCVSTIDKSVLNKFEKVDFELKLARERSILVENKIQNGELGYHVLNIAKDPVSKKFILVNRGWVEGAANRADIPVVALPERDWKITGRVYPVNSQMLSQKAELEIFDKIVRLPILDTHMLLLLEDEFGITLEPYLLRLDSESDGALKVDWAWISMTPEKHLGYALQWFGLSLAFLIISLFALIKKR